MQLRVIEFAARLIGETNCRDGAGGGELFPVFVNTNIARQIIQGGQLLHKLHISFCLSLFSPYHTFLVNHIKP